MAVQTLASAIAEAGIESVRPEVMALYKKVANDKPAK
jgi:hypothetical protein